MRRTEEGRHPEGQARSRRDHAGGHPVELLATALVVLLGTGGLVLARGPQQQLLALGPSPAPLAVPTSTTTTVVTTTTTRPPASPFVIALAPAPGARGVAPSSVVRIVLSSPPLPSTPLPTLHPAVPGHWAVRGATLTFTPTYGYAPWSTELVTVPAALAVPSDEWVFTVAGAPLLRVQQLLAELHYLPLRFGPSPTQSSLPAEPTVAGQLRGSPQPGVFTFRYPDVPPSLTSLWAKGQDNVLTQGAIMAFEADNGLDTDGVVSPQLWRALSIAVAHRKLDPNPYDYLTVSEALPEQLVVWRGGKDIYTTPVNTGVPGAGTPAGTWPVYERFVATTMIGTDPDGYHYDVTGVPWVAYFYGGDAVHGYWRYSYGYPQSNGCVELPVDNAQVVWSMDPIGTLVTVLS
jgi:lipoprotein-anchoring transpeptidase ErfK/SrfK